VHSLQAELSWFSKYAHKDYERGKICQCGTEKLIQRSLEPERMRAFLLVGVFIDQLVYTHYQDVYREFRKIIRLPKLLAHGAIGHISPSWLIYSRHGYDKNVNWDGLSRLATATMCELKKWLEDNNVRNYGSLNSIVAEEIRSEFDPIHCQKVLKAFNADKY
jgi:hypothetical protein